MNTVLWINFDKQVYIIRHNLHFDNFGLMLDGNILNQLLQPYINTLDKNFTPIFRTLYYMVLTGENNVFIASIFHNNIKILILYI